MKQMTMLLLGCTLALPAAGRAQRRETRTPVTPPLVGTIPRTAIPNEFLEITTGGGTINLSGSAGDSVRWSLSQQPLPPGGRLGHAQYVGGTEMLDRATLAVLDPSPDAGPTEMANLDVRVPRTLKLVHVTMHGAGTVSVANFSGEVDVVVDTGSISGEGLRGPVIFEARHGSIGLILPDSVPSSGNVNLLSHYGSIEITFGEHPSAAFDLVSNCGNIHWDAGLLSQLRPGNPTQSAGRYPDADCTQRPTALPPLPGVLHLHNNQSLRLGTGIPSITAMSIQGDIDIRQRP